MTCIRHYVPRYWAPQNANRKGNGRIKMKLADIIYANTGVSIDLTGLSNDTEGQALVASLMALVARSDGGISADETARMVELLEGRFKLSSDAAVNLVSRTADEYGVNAELDGLVANINEELSLLQKEDLMSMVLHVISADDRKVAGEMNLLAILIDRLNMPDSNMEKVYEQYFQERKAQD